MNICVAGLEVLETELAFWKIPFIFWGDASGFLVDYMRFTYVSRE